MCADKILNKGLIFDGMLFKTPNARCRYIGTVTAKRRQWLNDHPDEWRSLESISQEATPPPGNRVLQSDQISLPPSPTPPKVHQNRGTIRSIDTPIERAGSADNSPTAVDPSQIAKTELEIAGRPYISAARLAQRLGISDRTLSRWCADSNGPPHVKIQGVYFEQEKIWEWAASRGVTLSRLKETA
jgi:hypothetical protein